MNDRRGIRMRTVKFSFELLIVTLIDFFRNILDDKTNYRNIHLWPAVVVQW